MAYPSGMALPAESAILEALSRVQDPELRPQPDRARDGAARSRSPPTASSPSLIALTVPGCPLKAKIEGDITAELRQIDGVTGVAVAFTHMSEEERTALGARLRGGAASGGATREKKGLAIDNRTRVIAVASGKGGVGKSSLTVNLALALRAQGHEVGIIDADIYGFSIPGMLGIDQRPVTFDGMIVPPVAHEVKTISIGYFLDDEGAVMWRGPMLHRALEQFMTDVHWGGLDYLLIDMPPGTGDIAISLGQLFTEAGRRVESIIVTTPNQAAQRVAERAAAVAHRMKMEIAGVVENMSYRVCPCCGERDDVFGTGRRPVAGRQGRRAAAGADPARAGRPRRRRHGRAGDGDRPRLAGLAGHRRAGRGSWCGRASPTRPSA